MARGKTRARPRKKAKPPYTDAELSHIDRRGQAHMVDVSAKDPPPSASRWPKAR